MIKDNLKSVVDKLNEIYDNRETEILLENEYQKYRFIKEDDSKDVIGDVKKGELELNGKSVEDTSEEHFKELINKDGWDTVSKRIITLKVWNKNKDPELSSKMDKLQARLAKWVEDKRKENPDFGK